MTSSYIPYAQIPATAISQITEVIINDEGGFKFNDEAAGDWNYAGMISGHFQEIAHEIWEGYGFDQYTDKAWVKEQLSYETDEEKNELTIELYYNKFYLPVLEIFKSYVAQITSYSTCYLSCAINCGMDTFKVIMQKHVDADDTVEFEDHWEDHYIHLVVDNAKAWQAYAIRLDHPAALEPHPLRASNLQGWINRVRRYRDAS